MKVQKTQFAKAVTRKQLRKHQAQVAMQPTVKAVKMPDGPAVSAPTCMAPFCTGHPVTRDVCANCYSAARKLVADKIATWVQLEELGLVSPPHIKAAKNPLIVAFYAKTAGKKK